MSYAWCISSRCIASRFCWLLWDPGPSVCTLSVLVPAGEGRRFRERAASEYRIEGEPWEGEGAYFFLCHAHTPQGMGTVLGVCLICPSDGVFRGLCSLVLGGRPGDHPLCPLTPIGLLTPLTTLPPLSMIEW